MANISQTLGEKLQHMAGAHTCRAIHLVFFQSAGKALIGSTKLLQCAAKSSTDITPPAGKLCWRLHSVLLHYRMADQNGINDRAKVLVQYFRNY